MVNDEQLDAIVRAARKRIAAARAPGIPKFKDEAERVIAEQLEQLALELRKTRAALVHMAKCSDATCTRCAAVREAVRL